MNMNIDFSKRVVIDTNKQEWLASPAQGVWRKPLEREGKEFGHTTSVVKYDALLPLLVIHILEAKKFLYLLRLDAPILVINSRN